jgi:serine protease Do
VSLLGALSAELVELVGRTTPGVVGVEHARGQASGVVLADDGYVITNSHVLGRRAPQDIGVRFASGEALGARIVGNDPASDLAVVRVDARGLSSLPLADDRRLKVGQLVIAIGDPLRFERSVSLGVVSALERRLPGPRGRPFEGLVQTDAAINPGNSGGPLVDTDGCVVGINTAVIPHARGIGFAIPAHTASWVAAVLIQRGQIERPRLGVAAIGAELARALASELGQTRAVAVREVEHASPAHAAGLRPGDWVLSANGTAVFSVDDLQRAMVLATDENIALSIWRDGARRELVARPARRARAA